MRFSEMKQMASDCADELWKQVEIVRKKIEMGDEIASMQKAAKQDSDPTVFHHVDQLCEKVCQLAEILMTAEQRFKNCGIMTRGRVMWGAAMQLGGMCLWVPAAQAGIEPCVHEVRRYSLLGSGAANPFDRMELVSFGATLVFLTSLIFVIYMPFIPYELESMSILNPGHWHFTIPRIDAKGIYAKFYPAKFWLGHFANGLLLLILVMTLVNGQLGSDWIDENVEDRPFIQINPWFLWRMQVYMYLAEYSLRLYGAFVASRKGMAKISLAEEAAYTAQVEEYLLEIVMQVGDAAGPFHDIQNLLGDVAGKIRMLVYEGNRATKFESSSESEDGEPVQGWAHKLTKDKIERHREETKGNWTMLAQEEPRNSSASPTKKIGGPREVQEFIIDNRWLDAQTDGLGYRKSKNMEDHDLTRPVAPWFSSVFGFDEEDGWVQTEDGSFLPAYVDDKPVLTVPQEDAAAAASQDAVE